MARPKTKVELLLKADHDYAKLWDFISSMNYIELSTKFDFSKDPNKKKGHWKGDRNLRDILVQLYEWHQLLIKWINSNMAGIEKPFLPEPYNWETYECMNNGIWTVHQRTTFEDSKNMIIKSHIEVMNIIRKFTNEELFSRSIFSWTETAALGNCFYWATSSHYNWAFKKLKAHRKNCQKKENTR